MSWLSRFGLGGLGGLLPLFASLLALDIAAFAVLGNGAGIPTGIVVGYAIRVVLLFALGGIVAALNREVQNPLSLVQIGIAAPAIITSYVTGASINKPQAPPPKISQSSLFFGNAYAADVFAAPPLQLAGGFFNDVAKGLQPGLGVELQMNTLNVPAPVFDLARPMRVTNFQTSVCLNVPANAAPSAEQLAQSFPPDQFRIENGACP